MEVHGGFLVYEHHFMNRKLAKICDELWATLCPSLIATLEFLARATLFSFQELWNTGKQYLGVFG